MLQIKILKFFCYFLIITTIFTNRALLLDVARAEENKCKPAVIELVFRNSLSGKYIPDINFEIYKQTKDVDGRSIPGEKIASGKINDKTGGGEVSFVPKHTQYAIKAWQSNADVGNFWFFDNPILCGSKYQVTKYLSGVHFILRDAKGNLRKNAKFSLYTQRYDADNKPVKEKKDLVGTFNTLEQGENTLYVADNDYFLPGTIGGRYIFTVDNENGEFIVYNIQPQKYNIINFEYVFSDIVFSVKNAIGDNLSEIPIQIFQQDFDEQGNPIIGKAITTLKTDSVGKAVFEYPSGVYVAKIKDDVEQYFNFYNIKIQDNQRVKKELITNLIRISVIDDQEKLLSGKTIDVYNMVKDDKAWYYQNNKIKSLTINNKGYANISLTSNPYLFVIKYKSKFLGSEEKEYGHALYSEDEKLQKIIIRTNSDNEVTSGKKYKLIIPISKSNNGIISPPTPSKKLLVNKMLGYILLRVESKGEVWYVDKKTAKRYYIKNGWTAYQMFKQFGIGITNKDLNKIPIGLNDNFNNIDSDSDGLSDEMENALGADVYNKDSDNDGYLDGAEVKYDHNPLGKGKIQINLKLVERLKGAILLQVESKGEAWYINPKDGKRYYMKDGNDAYQIMKFLSLGITNKDLSQILEGEEL